MSTVDTAHSPPRRNITVEDRENEEKDRGYESDGGPCFDAILKEGEQDFDDDEELPISDANTVARRGLPRGSSVTSTTVGTFVDIDESKLQSLSVVALRHELKIRGKEVKGVKNKLQQRLRQALVEKAVLVSAGESSRQVRQGRSKELVGFPPTAYWELQEYGDDTPIEEPVNAPTVPVGELETVPIKYHYPQKWDRQPFVGEAMIPHLNQAGVCRKNNRGNNVMQNVPRLTGYPSLDFVSEHKLHLQSHPVEWMEAFMPITLYGEWTSYTNKKAVLENAGTPGFLYPDFEAFKVWELRQFVGLFMLNGLSPSPTNIEMKLQPASADPINGNDFVYRSLPSNAERRLCHFKKFFAVQDPLLTNTVNAPNFKVDPFVQWINSTAQSAWRLGKHLSVDEQTIGSQGCYNNKLQITYKETEGDGFQCDALCDNGYTYAFYFRNEPAPQKYITAGLSPLHSRVMLLFDSLKDKFHRVTLDNNVSMSARFALAAYTHPKQVLVAGVTREGSCSLPSIVVQEEEKTKARHMAVQGTCKVAVLKGVPEMPDLVVASIYDTKPVYFLSMSVEEIKWIVKERLVFSQDEKAPVWRRYLRLKIDDDYNYNRGSIDIADPELQENYRLDKWLPNTKWWWSIVLWGIGVQLVNCYKLYQGYCRMWGVPEKDIMSNYEFRKAIVMAYINPKAHDPTYPMSEENANSTGSSCSNKKRKHVDHDTSTDGGATGESVAHQTR